MVKFVVMWVATVLTVYGIETLEAALTKSLDFKLQQSLPFTVLKHKLAIILNDFRLSCNSPYRLRY